MAESFVLVGDCVERMREFPDNSIDAVVTDAPYGLGKLPDPIRLMLAWLAPQLREYLVSAGWSEDGAHELFPDADYTPSGGGFMGKEWDAIVPGPEVWRECYRVLKPGGHLLSSFGTRTVDLGGLAIRIAGFEVRDMVSWLYGQGFPKSLNIAQAVDKAAGVEGAANDWQGWGTALKPALEPIVLARKPLDGTVAANVQKWGTGGLNVDGCRIATDETWEGYTTNSPASVVLPGGTLNKRSSDSHPDGRWPANVVLDEVAAALLDEQTGDSQDPSRFFYIAKASRREREAGLEGFRKAKAGELTGGRAEGSAGLKSPRAGAGRTSKGRANTHPTVKPIALMRWLVRLITPPGGTVLDPFMGSGTTGCAALMEGFHFVGCELSEEYVAIAEARMAHWRGFGEVA